MWMIKSLSCVLCVSMIQYLYDKPYTVRVQAKLIRVGGGIDLDLQRW